MPACEDTQRFDFHAFAGQCHHRHHHKGGVGLLLLLTSCFLLPQLPRQVFLNVPLGPPTHPRNHAGHKRRHIHRK